MAIIAQLVQPWQQIDRRNGQIRSNGRYIDSI